MFKNIFDPDRLHSVAKAVVGLEGEDLISETRRLLTEAYPDEIWQREPEWLMSNAAGSMYGFCVLHASLHEYIIIYGTPIGTKGHTGRHRAEFWDFVLDGELLYYDEDKPFTRLVHRPGDQFYLRPGLSQGFVVPDKTWVLEYGRGLIPAVLPFGLADSLFSTLDFKTIWKTMLVYGQFYVPYLWRKAMGMQEVEARYPRVSSPAGTSTRRAA